jgi:hypothetical protein
MVVLREHYPLMSTLTDNFATANTAKWNWSTNYGTYKWLNRGGVVVLLPSVTWGSNLDGLGIFDATQSSASVELLRHVTDGNSYSGLCLFNAVDATDAYLLMVHADGVLRATTRINGVDTVQGAVTYNATNHRWLRISLGNANMLTFDTSPDRVTWTTLASLTAPAGIDFTAMRAELVCGHATGTAPYPALFANFNVTSQSFSIVSDPFYSTIDDWYWQRWDAAYCYGLNGQAYTIPTFGYSGGMLTWGAYDLTGTSVYVELVQATQGATGDSDFTISFPDGILQTGVYNGYLFFQHKIGNTVSTVASEIAYDPIAHRYLRFREASGTVYWDTSPDTVTWTNRASEVKPFAVVQGRIGLSCGSGVGSPLPVIWDNVNIAPASYSTLTENFSAALDGAKWRAGAGANPVSGQLVLTTDTNYTGMIETVEQFNLTGTSVQVEVPQFPYDANGEFDFLINATGIANPTADPANFSHYTLGWYSSGTNVKAWRSGAGDLYTATNGTGDGNHRVLRIREASGVIYWDSSPDGVTWTNRASWTPTDYRVNPSRLLFYSTEYVDAGARDAIVDNVNLTPTPSGFTGWGIPII